MSADELVARSRDKNALLVTLTEKLTSEAIAMLPPSVRIVATYSVGYDHIDLAAAKARGIRVSNTPDAVTVATAEIAMLLILGAARRAQEGERLLREKKWAGGSPCSSSAAGSTASGSAFTAWARSARRWRSVPAPSTWKSTTTAGGDARLMRRGRHLPRHARKPSVRQRIPLHQCAFDAGNARHPRRGRVREAAARGHRGEHRARRPHKR